MKKIIQHSRLFMRIAIVASGGLLLQACEQDSAIPKYNSIDYNVILISIDTLRADHLGIYGYHKNTSPNIDKFAADSVLFEKAIAHAPSTLPSHASLFTGLIPMKHGAFAAFQTPMRADVTTLPEVMRDAGFRTMSWNGGGLVRGIYGFDRGFEQYVTDRKNDYFRNKVDEATAWLDENSQDKFFLFLHTYETHDPYAPDPEYLALFEDNYDGEISNNIGSSEIGRINDPDRELTEADIEHVRNAYNAEIWSMDIAFGRLITYLREEGLYDNTMIILTSDHGEEFGEHGAVGLHFFTLYDELLHVPFIVKMPESQQAGIVVAEQVRGIDVFPTILDTLAINYAGSMDGVSLVPLMFGESVDSLVAVSQQDVSGEFPPTSVRTQDRKLIIRPAMLPEADSDYVWVKDRFEFETDATTVTLALASVSKRDSVNVYVNGRLANKLNISDSADSYPIVVQFGGQPGDVNAEDDERATSKGKLHRVKVESVGPCVPIQLDEVDIDCASFRVFDPQEFYALDEDPSELDNRYFRPAHADEIGDLREELRTLLQGGAAGAGESIEMDEETRRQLKSLGYLN